MRGFFSLVVPPRVLFILPADYNVRVINLMDCVSSRFYPVFFIMEGVGYFYEA